jgi:hypothetical protein
VKVGDLVIDNHPRAINWSRHGLLVARTRIGTSCLNKSFRVLWRDGTVGDNVWDYNLRVINEGR